MIGWLVLALPSLVARLLIRKKYSPIGIGQDLFVGLQLSFCPLILIPFFQLLILYDALIDKKLHFRLDGTTFSFLFQLGEFKDSAKDIGIFKWFFPYLFLACLPLLFPLTPSKFVFLGIPLFFIKEDNLIVLWEKQIGRFFLKPFRKSKGNFFPFVKKEILSKSEIYTPVSPNYPLFRYTHGFRGEVIAPIQIDKKPHVIFLFFESLRAREMECLGGRKEVLPHLNQLAKESYFFPNYYSNSLLTFRAFFTSHYGLPYTLKMTSGLEGSIPAAGLPDLLKDAGYQTNYLTGSHFDLGGIGPFLRNQGADFIFDKKDFRKRYREVHQGSWGVLDEYLFDVTLDHLETHRETPQFYTLLTITSHHPWTVPPNYEGPTFDDVKGAYTPKYLQTLHYTDRCVGNFIQELKNRGISKDVVLFIMGDHGLHLGENDRDYEYGRENQKDNFHVPLLIYADGRIPQPRVIETLGSHADLLPTCMDLLHLKGYQHSIGKSLLRKQDRPRIFFHAPVSLTDSVCCMEGNEVANSEEEHRLSPILKPFKKMMTMIFDEKKMMPPHLEKKKEHFEINPFAPPLELRQKQLMEAIKQKSPLSTLDLNQHQGVDDSLLMQISKWNPDLFALYISGSYRITDQGVIHLIKHCPSLIHLDLSDCFLLTKECLKKMPEAVWALFVKGLDFVDDHFFDQTVESLEILSIQRTPMTAKGLKKLSYFAPTLIKLSLSYSHFRMGEIREAIDPVPLWRLSIDECFDLSDEEALKIFHPHPHLRFLALAHCHSLTDALFDGIENTLLKHLTLQGLPQLTDEGFKKLLELPLDSLYVSACPKLTEKSLDLAKELTPKFKELSVEILGF